MKNLYVFKVGGNVIEDKHSLTLFVKNFVEIQGEKILVHGGGKTASEISKKLGITPKMIEGRRITDAQSLEVVTMVYAGLTNKKIVAQLQSAACNAIGLTGADGNLISAQKRIHPTIDYGFVGDFEPADVNTTLIQTLLANDLTPVCCAITHDGTGQLLNTNADTIAANIAVACSSYYKVMLVYCFEKEGVMRDIQDKNSVIKKIDSHEYQVLKKDGIIAGGMIPKIDSCFYALKNGVDSVSIKNAMRFTDSSGTTLAL